MKTDSFILNDIFFGAVTGSRFFIATIVTSAKKSAHENKLVHRSILISGCDFEPGLSTIEFIVFTLNIVHKKKLRQVAGKWFTKSANRKVAD